MNLPDKYRPQTVTDILGQPWIVDQLAAFIQSPYSCAFLMAGDTGTGKSSAAVALARDLGIAVDQEDYGGGSPCSSRAQNPGRGRPRPAACASPPHPGSRRRG